MRLKSVKIKEFRRFSDLNVSDIPETAKLILLCGPNGSGKSSFFDALATWSSFTWHTRHQNWDATYHIRNSQNDNQGYSSNHLSVEFHDDVTGRTQEEKSTAFYFRSAHRHDPDFSNSSVQKVGKMADERHVSRMIDRDVAVSKNYQRLAAKALEGIFGHSDDGETIKEFREAIIGVIRDSFLKIYPDLNLNGLGDPLKNGSFRFAKGAVDDFPYKNLSGGEKAAFDLVLGMHMAIIEYNDTIFCIDEPELHLNSRVQADLLSVLLDIIPDGGQLIIATHSLGMMRRAQDIERNAPGTVCFLDFDGLDFDKPQNIRPTKPTRAFWQRAYAVALDDLSTLIAPSRVVICEGNPKTATPSRNENHDAICYNQIFESEFPETRFISGGNCHDVASDRFVLLEAITQLTQGVTVLKLIDRDDRSEVEVSQLEQNGVRVLSLRNLESYLFNDEVLSALCEANNQAQKAGAILAEKARLLNESSGASDDLKPISGQLYVFCKKELGLTACGNDKNAFMRDTLAPLVCADMSIYAKLKADIFGPLTPS